MEIGDIIIPVGHQLWPFVSDDGRTMYISAVIASLQPLAVVSLTFEKCWIVTESEIKVVDRCSNLLTVAGCLAVWEKYKQENKDAVEKNFVL